MEKEILTLEDASNYLGVSRATMYAYTHNKVLPYYKPRGRKVYFKKSDLDDFVLNERVRYPSSSELEHQVEEQLSNKGGHHGK